MVKFLQKLTVARAKKANLLATFLGENIFKIITSVPSRLSPPNSVTKLSLKIVKCQPLAKNGIF
jgi:hypothetical protein